MSWKFLGDFLLKPSGHIALGFPKNIFLNIFVSFEIYVKVLLLNDLLNQWP